MVSIPVKLAIADDQTLVRKAIGRFLCQQTNLNVVFQASDTVELLNKLADFAIDVLLIQLFMPWATSEVLRKIRQHYPRLRILVLPMSTDLDLVSEMLDIGVYGCLSKSDGPEDLIQAILAAYHGQIYRNSLYTDALYWNEQQKVAKEAKQRVVLTEREKKILTLLWEEKSDKEIADDICLSVKSVEKIKHEMKGKLGVRSTIGLLKHSVENISSQLAAMVLTSSERGHKS
jgi:DNA-binding NarL/FixJ family response regulator